MSMTRCEFRIVSYLAGGNASATCLKMLVMCFADVSRLWVCFCILRRIINFSLLLLSLMDAILQFHLLDYIVLNLNVIHWTSKMNLTSSTKGNLYNLIILPDILLISPQNTAFTSISFIRSTNSFVSTYTLITVALSCVTFSSLTYTNVT